MPTSSISGLASGLDTAGIIDQLMQLEAISQNRLRTQQSLQKSVLTALQSLNTDVASLATKAGDLAKASTWQTLKATSSNPVVAATATATAAPTNFAVTVNQVATAAQTVYATDTTLGANVVSGSVTLTAADGKTYAISTGTGTLDELAKGINAANAGVTATTVRTGTNAAGSATYRLQVTAGTTGAATSAIGLTNVNLGTAQSTTGQDAQITVGTIASTSRSNTFTDIVPGVSLTLAAGAKTGDTATITVAQDATGVKTGVKALVDQVNALLTKIDTQSAHSTGTSTSSAGVLSGDSTVRSLRSAIVDTVFGASGTTSMASVGIQTDRYGKLVLDEAKFDAAYAADPAAVAAQFTAGSTTTTPAVPDGWAARLQTAARNASDARTGTLTTAITGRQSSIDRLGDDIDAWDGRLELRRTSLTRQFTALETALSTMQSQGNWLAGQLASLPTSSSS